MHKAQPEHFLMFLNVATNDNVIKLILHRKYFKYVQSWAEQFVNVNFINAHIVYIVYTSVNVAPT